MSLSRLRWLQLSYDIPVDVIQEICAFETTGVNIDRLSQNSYRVRVITALKKRIRLVINPPYTDKDLKKIARFVNYRIREWSRLKLIEAYQNLLKILSNPEITSNFNHGPISPEQTYNIDLLTVYYITKTYNIPVAETNKERVSNLRRYMSLSYHQLNLKLVDNLNDLTKAQMFSLLDKLKPKNIYKPDPDILTKHYNNKELQTPQNDHQAVALAARILGLDISNYNNPLQIYHTIKNNSNICKGVRKINQRFNSKLPSSFYDLETLCYFCTKYGYTNKQMTNKDTYELCKQHHKGKYFKLELGHPQSTK